jgi:hypothetical protein
MAEEAAFEEVPFEDAGVTAAAGADVAVVELDVGYVPPVMDHDGGRWALREVQGAGGPPGVALAEGTREEEVEIICHDGLQCGSLY